MLHIHTVERRGPTVFALQYLIAFLLIFAVGFGADLGAVEVFEVLADFAVLDLGWALLALLGASESALRLGGILSAQLVGWNVTFGGVECRRLKNRRASLGAQR